jgi:hypothetical protein
MCVLASNVSSVTILQIIMNPVTRYDELMAMPSTAPSHWAEPFMHQECSLHQLSPYIGKLKSSIAQGLIRKYSKPGELVADMFCGSGTVPLEAKLRLLGLPSPWSYTSHG